MSLRDQILSDIKKAIKSQNQIQLVTLRFLNSEIKNQEIALRPKKLTDADVVSVLKRLAKQRKDSIEQFERAGREDLVEKEKSELTILDTYLPEPLPLEKVEEVVVEVIDSLNVTSMKQMGLVIKNVISQTAGRADNKLISEVVKKRLQSISSP